MKTRSLQFSTMSIDSSDTENLPVQKNCDRLSLKPGPATMIALPRSKESSIRTSSISECRKNTWMHYGSRQMQPLERSGSTERSTSAKANAAQYRLEFELVSQFRVSCMPCICKKIFRVCIFVYQQKFVYVFSCITNKFLKNFKIIKNKFLQKIFHLISFVRLS